MSDLFISYAREDQEAVRALSDALAARERDVYVDWSIPKGAEWLAEIRAAIQGAGAMLFVISPDSARSEVCAQELAIAMEGNKRLIPVVHREPRSGSVPGELAKLNWIFLEQPGGLEAAIGEIVEVLDTDPECVAAHTRLLTRAIEWQNRGHPPSATLRGRQLEEAEAWLTRCGDREPLPTELHHRYILESRKSVTRRRQIAVGSILGGLAIAAVLGLLALQEREERQRLHDLATGEQLVEHSVAVGSQRPEETELRLLLAAEGMERFHRRQSRSVEAERALRRALAAAELPPTVVPDLPGVDGAALDSSGGFLGVWRLDRLQLWDLATRRMRASWRTPLAAGMKIKGLAVDSTGERVLAAIHPSETGGRDTALRLFDVAGGRELASCQVDDFRPNAALGPGGKLIASTFFPARLLHPADCRELAPWGEELLVYSLAIDDRGRFIGVALRVPGERRRVFRLWDLEAAAWRDGEWAIGAPPVGIILTAGGRFAAVHTGKSVAIVDLESGRPPSTLDGVDAPVALSTDGRLLAHAGEGYSVVLRDAASGFELQRLAHNAEVKAAGFGPDGAHLTTFSNGRFRVWELATATAGELALAEVRALAALQPASDAATWFDGGETVPLTDSDRAVSPDGLREVSIEVSAEATRGGHDVHLVLRDAGKGDELARRALARSLYGVVAARLFWRSGEPGFAVAEGGLLTVYNGLDLEPVARLPDPGARGVVWGPSGLLAAGGEGGIRVWRLEDGAEVARIDRAPVTRLAFSPDGRSIAGAAGEAVMTWPIAPEDLIADACGRLSRDLGPEEWRSYLGDEPYRPVCAERASAG